MVVGSLTAILFTINLVCYYIFKQFYLAASIPVQSENILTTLLYILVIAIPSVMFTLATVLFFIKLTNNKTITIVLVMLSSFLFSSFALLLDHLDFSMLARLLDGSAEITVRSKVEYWTESEKNIHNLYMDVELIINRIFWLMISTGVFYLTAKMKGRSQVIDSSVMDDTNNNQKQPEIALNFKAKSLIPKLFLSQIILDLRSLVLQKTFWYVLITYVCIVVISVYQSEGSFGAQLIRTSSNLYDIFNSLSTNVLLPIYILVMISVMIPWK